MQVGISYVISWSVWLFTGIYFICLFIDLYTTNKEDNNDHDYVWLFAPVKFPPLPSPMQPPGQVRPRNKKMTNSTGYAQGGW